MHDWQSEEYVQEWKHNQNDAERATQYMRRLVNLIPKDPDEELRVLDLGGGYGALSKVVLETYPHATVVLHDYSEPMLDEARQHLSAYSDSVSFVRGDLMSPGWVSELKGEFDAIVSTIAIHNVRFPDRIRGIYHELFPYVAPGGCFLNWDEVVPVGPLLAGAERHANLMERRRRVHDETGEWQSLETVASSGGRRGGGMGPRREATSEEGQERLTSHEPATLVNQVKWLQEAGFDEVDCFVRDGRRMLIGAYRKA
jgi:tRNA (cmo5U34)-methyltransferase